MTIRIDNTNNTLDRNMKKQYNKNIPNLIDKKKNGNKINNRMMNIMQLLPAFKVNIIIVHPRGVVFPMFTASAGNNCFIIPKFYLQ